jgi:Ca2+-transporting ATPase
LPDNADREDQCQSPRSSAPVHEPPYARPIETVLGDLETDTLRGLTGDEARQRLQQHGPNELRTVPAEPLWRKFLRQFEDLVVWLLIVAAVVSIALQEWVDAIAILIIVLLNAVLGFVQEERAGRALAALQKLAAPIARAFRDGRLQPIAARELVPGDIVDLDAGDHVPADARLIEAFSLRVQEAALTGESSAVDKRAGVVLDASAPLGDRRNMVYLGTIIAGGKGRAVVVGTGMQTELGRIAGLLEAYEPEPTPLQRKLAELGKVLAIACVVLVAIIFVLEWLRGRPLIDTFLLAVSLAVAAVPEGLPAVVTVSLALGLQRMVKRNALIRKLPSVETLGAVTVICTDKTGTLTRNEMTVREIATAGARYRVTGSGYAPEGEFRKRMPDGTDLAVAPLDDGDLRLALTVGERCNHAQVLAEKNGRESWKVVGDPTEGALKVAASKARLPAGEHSPSAAGAALKVLHEIPFDSERKAMSLVVANESGRAVMYTKGAPEVVLAFCTTESRDGHPVPLDDRRRGEIITSAAEMASRALRVLALASREWPQTVPDRPEVARENPGADAPGSPDFTETELDFAGLVGMIDPPREEVGQAVAVCRDAGIRPIMITGDHPETALAIARELGIAGPDELVVTGVELDRLPEENLSVDVERISVYARVTAENKLRIVRAWKNRGEVVAMTGDGVNDAPAVKAADIGIAMGITGTDVTRETSDMVLMDDNFASIVSAVEEGRAIYDNIQKFLVYLLSCNIGEMLTMLSASLMAWKPPLLPVHLLLINLVTDGLPALALGLEPPEPEVMSRRPRSPEKPMLSLNLGGVVLWQGALLAAVALAAFRIGEMAHPNDPGAARTMTFCVVVAGELFRALAARSRRWTFVQLGPFGNPYLLGAVVISGLVTAGVILLPFSRQLFPLADHAPWEWIVLGLLSLTPITVIELRKLLRQYSKAAKTTKGSRESALDGHR